MSAEVKAEFWVMRVVLSMRDVRRWKSVANAQDANNCYRFEVHPRIREAFLKVRAGEYTEAGGMGILEPVEVYDSNVKATEAAIALAKQHPNETFVTVLNADPDDLAKDPTADGAMTS